MTVGYIRNVVVTLIPKYPISKITLFGSRAAGTESTDSDVDLIIEFSSTI